MLRALRCASVLLVCGVLTVACHGAPHAPSATGTSPASPVKPDQSKVFFPATVDTYGLTLAQTDRDHLAELYALRQIDPCGFVDQQTPGFVDRPPPALHSHKDYSYTYADGAIDLGPIGPGLDPVGGDSCLIALPATKMGLVLAVWPGDPDRYGDDTFSPDPSHPGVARSTTWGRCVFRVALPLTGLTGAPKSMRDPVLQVDVINLETHRWNVNDTSLCGLAEALAGDIAGLVRDKGIPVHAGHGGTAAKFLTGDPCATAPDLRAVGFIWHDPPSRVQYPTTWRHPGICNLRLTKADNGSKGPSAVVKYGLVAWSDKIIDEISGETPGSVLTRGARDGVTLFDFTRNYETGCWSYVLARTNLHIEPIVVGAGAPGLPTSTPMVTIRLDTPAGSNCSEIAKQAALAAVKRGT
jgi:hypothetical protein